MAHKEHSIEKIKNISYIALLVPELKNAEIKLIHKPNLKRIQQTNNRIHGIQKESSSSNQEQSHQLTGSPLEYESMSEDESLSEFSLLSCKMWTKEEEFHDPIDKDSAPVIISSELNTQLKEKDKILPIFAICECSKMNGTVLLGAYVEKTTSFFCNVKVDVFQAGIPVSQLEFVEIPQLVGRHAAFAGILKKEHQIQVSSRSEYNIFGNKSEYINKSDFLKRNFKGNLSIQSTWDSLHVRPDFKSSKNNLFLETAANFEASSLKHFWQQQLLLHEYLNVLENYMTSPSVIDGRSNSRYNSVPLEFPSTFETPFVVADNLKAAKVDTMERLESLLQGEHYATCFGLDSSIEKCTIQDDENNYNVIVAELRLEQVLAQLEARENQDFTDHLWNILRACTGYDEIVQSIDVVLSEGEKNSRNIQINSKNATRLAKFLTSSETQCRLKMHKPLELLIDIGIEKLSNDYLYLLQRANFLNVHEIRQKLENFSKSKFSIENYRKKLLTISQLSICLEFVILAQAHLNYPTSDLQRLFDCAYKKYCSTDNSPLNSFRDILENSIFNVEIPIPARLAKLIYFSSPPFLHRVELSSKSQISELRTIWFYSVCPIFPPNIFKYDENLDINQEETCYYKTLAYCTLLKFKSH